jgi:hypothetical protein
MQSSVECYFVILDLHGPEDLYQPIYEVLKELRAEKLPAGFPVWMFAGEPDSHNKYQDMFVPLLPPLSVYQPEVGCGFLLMSARGYGAHGVYNPTAD